LIFERREVLFFDFLKIGKARRFRVERGFLLKKAEK